MVNHTGHALKSFLKPVHIWIGIVSGVFLSVIALTGSVIVFRADLERASAPRDKASAATQASVDEAARQVGIARPDARIRRVRLPQAGEPFIFQVESDGKRTERIVASASSGRVLGVLETRTVDWLIDLHRNLLEGKQGRNAVGVFGIALFILSVSGILMWFAGARNWQSWTSVRPSGSARRFNFELHRATGLWACVFLAVISFTGVERAYPDSFRAAVQALGSRPADARAPKKIKYASMRPFEEYLRSGHAAMPDGVPVELRLPGAQGPVDLRLYRHGDFSPSGNHVYLDPATAKVLQVDRIADRPMGARFLAALAPIHYGEFGGIPVKLTWALAGLTPVLLFITGLAAWWRPRQKKSPEAAAQKAGSENLAVAGR